MTTGLFDPRRHLGGALAVLLTLARLGLAPLVIRLAQQNVPPRWLAVCLLAGFTSDVLDGIVARWAGVASARLRLLDSVVDTVFYLGIAATAWLRFQEALRPLAWFMLAIIGLEFANYLLSWAKLGAGASYHAYSAKGMGIALFGALFALFWWQTAALIPAALVVAFVAQAEVAAITWILPTWAHDVRSVWHAKRLRDTVRRTMPPNESSLNH